MSDAPAARAARRWRWMLLAAVFVAVAIAAIVGAAVTDQWARTSQGFCLSCHGDVRSHTAEHRATACQSCHTTTTTERLSLATARWRGAAPTSAHAPARSTTCNGCHGATAAFRSSAGHTAHASGSNDCVRCHAGSLHDRPTPREGCTSCHANVPMRSEPRDEGACVRCHEFAPSARDAASVVRTGIAPAAHGTVVDTSRLHGAVDCRQCHNPHRAPQDPAIPNGNDCSRCHRGHIGSEVAAGPAGHQACTGCHDVHADRQRTAVQCDRCHTAPHREAPTRAPADPNRPDDRHARDITPALRAWLTAAGAEAPSASAPRLPNTPVHADWTHDGRCSSCHRPHTWTARTTDCRSCHSPQATSLTPESPHGRNECTSCHDPHGPPPTTAVCASCHTSEQHLASAAPSGHAACTGCHQPHAPARPTAAVCATCHPHPHDQVARGPAQHANCLSCHPPHGAAAASTPTTCASCHRTEADFFATQPAPAEHRRCEACHADHDFTRQTARNACSRCHENLADHRGSHRGECTSCHSPHAPVAGPDLRTCVSCHNTVHIGGPPAPMAAHSRCEGCHQPHRPAAEAANACRTCHAVEWTASRTWPSASPHGGDCRQCHAPHLDRPRPDCVSCHAAQNTTDHRGSHTQCTQCHAVHRELPSGGGSQWWSRCAECHRAEGDAARATTTSSTHRQCANCHQRPGLRAPTCVGCHTTIQTTLLHATPQHGTCASCHASHGNAPPTRAQCVSCHTDRTGHFPDAASCQSCHPFSPTGGR